MPVHSRLSAALIGATAISLTVTGAVGGSLSAAAVGQPAVPRPANHVATKPVKKSHPKKPHPTKPPKPTPSPTATPTPTPTSSDTPTPTPTPSDTPIPTPTPSDTPTPTPTPSDTPTPTPTPTDTPTDTPTPSPTPSSSPTDAGTLSTTVLATSNRAFNGLITTAGHGDGFFNDLVLDPTGNYVTQLMHLHDGVVEPIPMPAGSTTFESLSSADVGELWLSVPDGAHLWSGGEWSRSLAPNQLTDQGGTWQLTSLAALPGHRAVLAYSQKRGSGTPELIQYRLLSADGTLSPVIATGYGASRLEAKNGFAYDVNSVPVATFDRDGVARQWPVRLAHDTYLPLSATQVLVKRQDQCGRSTYDDATKSAQPPVFQQCMQLGTLMIWDLEMYARSTESGTVVTAMYDMLVAAKLPSTHEVRITLPQGKATAVVASEPGSDTVWVDVLTADGSHELVRVANVGSGVPAPDPAPTAPAPVSGATVTESAHGSNVDEVGQLTSGGVGDTFFLVMDYSAAQQVTLHHVAAGVDHVVPSPNGTLSSGATLSSADAGELWLLTGGVLYHYRDGAWQTLSLPATAPGGTLGLTDVGALPGHQAVVSYSSGDYRHGYTTQLYLVNPDGTLGRQVQSISSYGREPQLTAVNGVVAAASNSAAYTVDGAGIVRTFPMTSPQWLFLPINATSGIWYDSQAYEENSSATCSRDTYDDATGTVSSTGMQPCARWAVLSTSQGNQLGQDTLSGVVDTMHLPGTTALPLSRDFLGKLLMTPEPGTDNAWILVTEPTEPGWHLYHVANVGAGLPKG